MSIGIWAQVWPFVLILDYIGLFGIGLYLGKARE